MTRAGSDAAAHMSEEVKDAGLVVPRAIICSYVVNGFMGLILLITYLFCIPSVDDAIGDPTGYPFLYVFRSHMSVGAANALTALVLVLVISSNIDFNASASRQAFAFARDKGLPFSSWISHVNNPPPFPLPTPNLTCHARPVADRFRFTPNSKSPPTPWP